MYIDHVHMSNAGNRLTAHLLAEWLADHGLLTEKLNALHDLLAEERGQYERWLRTPEFVLLNARDLGRMLAEEREKDVVNRRVS